MKVAVLMISLMLVHACIAKVIIEYDHDSDESEYGTDEFYEYEHDLGLTFPHDCHSQTLRNFAIHCGLRVLKGKKHFKVKDPRNNNLVTTIPRVVKDNGTCHNIINALNARCE